MRLLSKRSRHRHQWNCLRVRHFTAGGYINPSDGIRTQVNWKCAGCGKLRVTDVAGTWQVEDFH